MCPPNVVHLYVVVVTLMEDPGIDRGYNNLADSRVTPRKIERCLVFLGVSRDKHSRAMRVSGSPRCYISRRRIRFRRRSTATRHARHRNAGHRVRPLRESRYCSDTLFLYTLLTFTYLTSSAARAMVVGRVGFNKM